MTELALSTLGEMRKEESFSKFWASLNEKLDDLDVDEPTLPRRRKMPKRFEPGNAPPEFPTSAKDLYRQQYFEALDLVVSCVKDRFNQPGYQVYRHLEDVLLKCVHVHVTIHTERMLTSSRSSTMVIWKSLHFLRSLKHSQR